MLAAIAVITSIEAYLTILLCSNGNLRFICDVPKIVQQQPSPIPLSGLSYMDESINLCPQYSIKNHVSI